MEFWVLDCYFRAAFWDFCNIIISFWSVAPLTFVLLLLRGYIVNIIIKLSILFLYFL